MAQQLLTKYQTAARFAMAPATFARHRASLIAQGLKVVHLDKSKSKPRYVERSVNALIDKAEKRGTLL